MARNGYLTDAELTDVGKGHRLANVTAAAWLAAVGSASRDGVVLAPVASFNQAATYRSWAVQLDMRARPRLYSITPGIVPGLPSNHGFGTCVDVGLGLAWMIRSGSRFGFRRPISNDPNHFLHDGTTTAGGSYTPIGGTNPIPVPPVATGGDMYDANARNEIIGRLDALTQRVADLASAIVPAISAQSDDEANLAALIKQSRSGRVELYMNRDTGAIAAALESARYWYEFATMAELDFYRATGLAPQTPAIELSGEAFAVQRSATLG